MPAARPQEVVPGVQVDLDGLIGSLRSRDYYSLPVEVRPRRRGADLVELAAAVETAIDAAGEQARSRVPTDPTASTSADVALTSVVLEVNDGLMTETEVTTWLTDFATALHGQEVRVVASSVDKRIRWQAIEEWRREKLFTPAAFLHFTSPEHRAPNGRMYRERDPNTIDAIADYLAGWVRVPSGMTTISRGANEFVCPPGQAAAQLRAVHDPQLTLAAFTLAPRRRALAEFGFGGEATLTYFDETSEVNAALDRIVDALRTVGHLLEYGYARMSHPVGTSNCTGDYFGRARAVAEEFFPRRYNADEFAIGPCVAQVLNPRHLAKGPVLEDFVCEELDNGRLLAVARDPEPWVNDQPPSPELIEKYDADFAPLTLTRADFERERDADRDRWGLRPR